MAELLLDQLEELEDKIVPLLRRRGIAVQAIQPIGLLGRGAHSSVFSLLINNRHHVLKVYNREASFEQELRNRRKLTRPPQLVLTSRRHQNSLAADLIITKVPPGRTFSSDDLTPSISLKLASHLLDLHRVKRRRKIKTDLLASRLQRSRERALGAVELVCPERKAAIIKILSQAEGELRKQAAEFELARSLIHGDLWWSNIIVTSADVYLIDWENVRTGDYLEDLSMLRTRMDNRYLTDRADGFWQGLRDPDEADRFVARIAEHHGSELPDLNYERRLRWYLVLYSLTQLRDLYLSHQKGFDVADRIRFAVIDLERFWAAGLRSVSRPVAREVQP